MHKAYTSKAKQMQKTPQANTLDFNCSYFKCQSRVIYRFFFRSVFPPHTRFDKKNTWNVRFSQMTFNFKLIKTIPLQRILFGYNIFFLIYASVLSHPRNTRMVIFYLTLTYVYVSVQIINFFVPFLPQVKITDYSH